MSIPIVEHVREKSTSRGSARTLLLDLAIYANDCCGVAWPADATLYHEVHVSRQRVHELKNRLEDLGELVIVERPGTTNLYFVAAQGKPLGGTPLDTRDGHHPRCPLRHPQWAAACAHLWANPPATPDVGEGSECPDPPVEPLPVDNPPALEEGSECSAPQGSETSDGGGQESLPQISEKSIDKITGRPALAHTHHPQAPPPSLLPKAEEANPFYCRACGFAIPSCQHRVVYVTEGKKGVLRVGARGDRRA